MVLARTYLSRLQTLPERRPDVSHWEGAPFAVKHRFVIVVRCWKRGAKLEWKIEVTKTWTPRSALGLNLLLCPLVLLSHRVAEKSKGRMITLRRVSVSPSIRVVGTKQFSIMTMKRIIKAVVVVS